MTMYNYTHDMMIIRAGMELGQVLSEEQRKERFSSSMRRKRAAAQEVEKIILMKKSWNLNNLLFSGNCCSCGGRKRFFARRGKRCREYFVSSEYLTFDECLHVNKQLTFSDSICSDE